MPKKTIYYTADIVHNSRGLTQVHTQAGKSIQVLECTTATKITEEVMKDLEREMQKCFPYTWANRVKIGLRMSDDLLKVAPNLWSDSVEESVELSNPHSFAPAA